jgi:hypothetical protein
VNHPWTTSDFAGYPIAPVMSPQTGPFFQNERRYAAAKWDCAPVTGGHFGGGSCSGCQYPTVREVPVFGGQYIGIKILIYGASSMNQKNADGGTQETADGC